MLGTPLWAPGRSTRCWEALGRGPSRAPIRSTRVLPVEGAVSSCPELYHPAPASVPPPALVCCFLLPARVPAASLWSVGSVHSAGPCGRPGCHFSVPPAVASSPHTCHLQTSKSPVLFSTPAQVQGTWMTSPSPLLARDPGSLSPGWSPAPALWAMEGSSVRHAFQATDERRRASARTVPVCRVPAMGTARPATLRQVRS